MVGVERFELPVPCSQSKCVGQTTLHSAVFKMWWQLLKSNQMGTEVQQIYSLSSRRTRLRCLLDWQAQRGSNSHNKNQSLGCYHYTMGQCTKLKWYSIGELNPCSRDENPVSLSTRRMEHKKPRSCLDLGVLNGMKLHPIRTR